jgi:hypothetical protein
MRHVGRCGIRVKETSRSFAMCIRDHPDAQKRTANEKKPKQCNAVDQPETLEPTSCLAFPDPTRKTNMSPSTLIETRGPEVVMRIRTAVVLALLVLPAALSAQRMPRGRRGPARPAELPPQPAAIANQMAYQRSKLTVEAYPFISHFNSPGFIGGGIASSWTSLGTGTRFDYRITRFVSATADVTSSLLGGPAVVTSGELGTRLHPERSESRFYPYADVRFGYISAYLKDPRAIAAEQASAGFSTAGPADRFSDGWGGFAGIGTEIGLVGAWSMTTGAGYMRNHMTERGIRANAFAPHSYSMGWYRYTIGISYNPVHLVRSPGSDNR